MRRRFNSAEREALYLAADGKCESCGVELEPSWHADHIRPFARNGQTDITNGAALCPTCNERKGATMAQNVHTPRVWQTKFIEKFEESGDDFTLIACPAAGKTNAAFMAALHQLHDGGCDQLLFVVPADSLRSAMVTQAGEWGLRLKRNDHRNQLLIPKGHHGIVTTYASIAANPGMYADWVARHRVFVVMDEAHHAGDANQWGSALISALGGSQRKLLMSGTPWRKSGDAIPFASYDVEGNLKWDFEFTFREAWQEPDGDRAVRYVAFEWMDAHVHFITGRGTQVNQRLSECDDDILGQALDNTYLPTGEWVSKTVREAHRHLESIRQKRRPDAAGLLLAPSVSDAHRYADIVQRETGTRPTVVVADDDTVDSGAAIKRFRDGSDPWIIAVRQISEGVDIPRLMVEVFASDIKTPLFFHQAVGRILRRRRDASGWMGEPDYARVYLPQAAPFQVHAAEMEDMLSSALKEKETESSERDGEVNEQSSLRIDFGNDQAYVAGVSFATGGMLNPEELERAEELLGMDRHLAAGLLKQGVKFPPKVAPTSTRHTYVTDQHDPAELDRLRLQLETYSRRYAHHEGLENWQVNQELLQRFGKRASMDAETLREAIEWLKDRL